MERQIHISQNLSGEYIVYDGNPKDRRRQIFELSSGRFKIKANT